MTFDPPEARLAMPPAPREPHAGSFPNPLPLYVAATRPAFLLASIAPALIGLATARADGVALHAGLALLTLLGATLAHAGTNVLNDYYDARNGGDAINTERLYPFTGGSRFIQNGVLTPRATATYGVALLAAAALIGVLLAFASGPLLWLIGAAGLLTGWAYSAPPLSLNSRGLGELSVAAGFGLLIPMGADYVQRGTFACLPLMAGAPYALLVANLLYINQFPDRRADEAVGKRHWVVRLGARRARWLYPVAAALAGTMLLAEVAFGVLPRAALTTLLPLLLSLAAARILLRHAEAPAALTPAIRLTILAAITHALLLAVALAWSR